MGRARTDAPGDDGRFDHDHEHIVDEEWQSAAVRRAPRHGRIIALGLLVGFAGAVVHTAVSAGTAEPKNPVATGLSGVVRTFGVLAAVWVGACLLLATTVVIVLDRVVGRRIRPVVTEHTVTLTDDLVSPVTDDIPTWVRDADDLAGGPRGAPARPPEG